MFRKKPQRPTAFPEPVMLTPIGVVENEVQKPRPHGWERVTSRIWLRDEYAEMLTGLEGFSHAIIVGHAHLIPPEVPATSLRRVANDPDRPEVGWFATRVQARPNHLMVSPVRILKVEEGRLDVRGLDAVNGTPVLDIKPYLPSYDALPDASIPQWAK